MGFKGNEWVVSVHEEGQNSETFVEDLANQEINVNDGSTTTVNSIMTKIKDPTEVEQLWLKTIHLHFLQGWDIT